MIKKYLIPDLYVDDIYHINYEELYKSGIRVIIFDIDNTLKTYDEKVPTDKNIQLFNTLKSIGFEICLLSNGRKSRVNRYNERINLKAEYLALKPLAFKFKNLLKHYNVEIDKVAIIGDQIFTDVFLGKRKHIKTILVKPIKEKSSFVEKIKRKLEKVVLKMYNNTQCL